ncbi:halovibrin HvnC [Pseudomonas sp. BGI-2]|uniref:halovibrin HvnC n=1 Tax=Pseudomonas sp. BGI-2 TaxID=2528211 RepID=UPI0010349ED2|nr:halovibrin HvnC [Pseudomonas sp. BGI-2]TBN35547.1 halovibrin HvnC [Pseudomonas sp. BGI-2]
MKRIILTLFVASALGCVHVDSPTQDFTASSASQVAMTGPEVVTLLTTLYNRVDPNCKNFPTAPAFLCSGIVLRVTDKKPGETHHVWNPSDTSVRNDGVSFSYIRKDANVGRLAWGKNNGYMLYPIFGAPHDKVDLDFLCSFPIDGWTWNRTTPCGAHASFPSQSQRCRSAGVTTAEQWKAVWDSSPTNQHIRQCGFDVSEATGKPAADAFYQSVRARGMLGATGFNEQNEIVIKTWSQNMQQTLPLMAFFYIFGGNNDGLEEARNNQKDFYDSTNPRIWVPVIRLIPSSLRSGNASFQYAASDQLVSP